MLSAAALQESATVGPQLLNLDQPPTSPFPIGDGPFRVKGTVLWGLNEYVAERVPGGLPSVIARLPSAELRDFCAQAFAAAGWYDFLPVLRLLAAAGELAKVSAARFIAEHAVWQAQRDVRGVHRLLLKLASPEQVALRFPIAFSRYFDFAEIGDATVTEGKLLVTVRGLPAMLVDWYKTSVMAGGTAILEMAGARHLTCAFSALSDDAPKHGVRTVSFHVTRTWR